MTKDQVQELMMGAALVALGYALWQHFKRPASPAAATSQAAAQQQAGGAEFAYGEPSPFTTLQDLLSGAVHDIGSWNGENYLADLEAAPATAGGAGPRVPGGYW